MILKILAIIFVVFAASRAYFRFKDKSLSIWNLFFWVIVWVSILAFVFDPTMSDKIAKFLGLQRGTDSIFFIAIILLFYLMFRLYVKIDRLDKDTTKLVVAISKEFHNSKKLSGQKEK